MRLGAALDVCHMGKFSRRNVELHYDLVRHQRTLKDPTLINSYQQNNHLGLNVASELHVKMFHATYGIQEKYKWEVSNNRLFNVTGPRPTHGT